MTKRLFVALVGALLPMAAVPVAVAAGAGTPAAPGAASAPAPSAQPTTAAAMAGCVVAKLNALRASSGLDPLVVDDALSTFAQSWSERMAAVNSLSHNPDLDRAPGKWSLAGENVGVGPDVNLLFDGFVASEHHYVNLVDPTFTRVGIGVSTTATGLIYTTQDFEAASPDAAPSAATITPLACASAPSTRLSLSLRQTSGVEPL